MRKEPTGKTANKTDFVTFMAERASAMSSETLAKIRAAAEAEITEASNDITDRMLRKALEHGYAMGRADAESDAQAQSPVPLNGDA